MGSVFQKSLLFGGTDEYVTMGDATPLKFIHTDAFSLSCWFRWDNTTGGILVAKAEDSVNFRGYFMATQDTDGTVVFFVRNTVTTNFAGVNSGGTWNDGLWHHMVGTYDGSTAAAGLNIYIDGVAQSVSTVGDNLSATIDTTAAFQIGARDGAGVPILNTNLCQAAVYDVELTAAQVTAIYNLGDPPDLRLTGPRASLVGYWPLGDGDDFATLYDRNPVSEQSSTVPDESNNSNDGTATNMEAADVVGLAPTGSFSRKSLRFDGSTEYVAMGDVLDRIHTDAFSISCWFKTTSTGGMIVSKSLSSGTFRGYSLDFAGATGSVRLLLTNDGVTGPNEINVSTPLEYNDGLWHHLLASYDGSEAAGGCHIWIDGTDVSLTVTTDTLSATISSAAHFNVGARDGGDTPVTAQIDDVAVYDVALTAAQAKTVFNASVPADLTSVGPTADLAGYWKMGDGDTFSTITDHSTGGNDGTMFNMAADDIEDDAPGAVFSPKSMLMDGTNEYVAVGDVAALQFAHTDAFSLSVWFRTISSGTESLAAKRLNAGTFRGWALTTSSGALVWQLVNTTSTNLVQVTTTAATFADGNWHHALVTYDGLQAAAGAKVYVDGVLQAVTENNDTLSATLEGGGLFQIGALAGTANFDGALAEVAAWDRELSSLDVRDVYNSGIPNNLRELWSGTDLAGWWRMGNGGNDGTATNMEAADVAQDAPHGQLTSEEVVTVDTLDNTTLETGAPTPLYRMRGIDDGVGPPVRYVFWDVQDTPDFDGSRATVTSPPLVGSIVADSIAAVNQS